MGAMTTHDPSSHSDHIVATFADGESARRASLAIETLGIDSSRVSVDAKRDLTDQVAESNVDSATIQRPRNRAVTGAIVGAVVGAVVGVVVGMVFDAVPAGMALVLFIIPGVIIGALFGLYSRLPTNPEISDADAGGPVELIVDLSDLDDEERASALEKLKAEQPIRLAEA
jgi:hypothetical protein